MARAVTSVPHVTVQLQCSCLLQAGSACCSSSSNSSTRRRAIKRSCNPRAGIHIKTLPYMQGCWHCHGRHGTSTRCTIAWRLAAGRSSTAAAPCMACGQRCPLEHMPSPDMPCLGLDGRIQVTCQWPLYHATGLPACHKRHDASGIDTDCLSDANRCFVVVLALVGQTAVSNTAIAGCTVPLSMGPQHKMPY